MSFSAFVVAGWGLRLSLGWLVLIRTGAEVVDNATLCQNSSFVSRSGYLLSESYPDPVASEAHSCQCSVYGESELTIVFAGGSIQDTCNEQFVITDTDSTIVYDSCQEIHQLINKTALKKFVLKGDAPARVTFVKYDNRLKRKHGYFKLNLTATSVITVNCSSNRHAEIPFPEIPQRSKFSWIIIVYVVAVLFLVALVMVLIVCMWRKCFPKLPKQKSEHPVSPLHHLEHASRRRRERLENDYALTPAQTTNVHREYEEIPAGGFRSTQQTNLADDAVTELNTEITGSNATGGNDQNGPDTDLFAERTLPAEPNGNERIDSASEGNGSNHSQVNKADNAEIEANSFVDFSAELVENVAYKYVEAEPHLSASEGNGSNDSQVNKADNEANLFVDFSAELVENVAYKFVEAEPHLSEE